MTVTCSSSYQSDSPCRHKRPHLGEQVQDTTIRCLQTLRVFSLVSPYYGPLKGRFKKHILQHLSRPTPNPPPPYNYSLLLRLSNSSVCAQDSTIPWFCWPFVIGHGTPSTQLDGHVVFDFSDREWLHWNRVSWMQWWTMPAVPGGYKHSFCLCGKLHLDLLSFLTEPWMFSNEPFWNMLC